MELVVKKWGRSLGAVIPAEKAKQLNLKENDIVRAHLVKQENDLSRLFGKFKFSRPIEEILRESDRECWDE